MAVLTALSFRWTRDNGFLARPPLSDSAGYRNTSLMLLQTWHRDGFTAFLEHTLELGGAHPPTVTAITAACAVLRGHDEITLGDMWAVAAAFGILSAFGCYVLARRFLSPLLALAAAMVAQCTPVIIDDWWRLYTQLPMVACILWAYSAALESDGFTRRRPSIAFGLWAGAAWMIKSIAPLYLIGVGAAVVVAARRGETRAALVNLGLAGLGVAVVAGPWYAMHFDTVTGYAGSVVGEEGQQVFSMGMPLWSLERWLYYPTQMAGHGLAAPMALLVLIALVWGASRLLRGRIGSRAAVMTTTLVVAYVILTVGQTQTRAWYVMSFVPLLAILLVRFAALLTPRSLGAALGIAIAASCVFNVYLTQRPMARDFDPRFLGPVEVVPCTHGIYSLLAPSIGAHSRPDAEPWPHRDWVRRMIEDSTRRDPSVFLTVYPDYRHPLVNTTTLDYEGIRLKGRRLDGRDEFEPPFLGAPDEVRAVLLRDVEFIVHDHRRLDLPILEAGLEALGFVSEVIETRVVTEKSTLSLLRLRERHHPPLRIDEDSVASHGLRTCRTSWADGTRLTGTRVLPLPDGRTSVVLALTPGHDAGLLRVVVTARTRSGGTPVRVSRHVPMLSDDRTIALAFDLDAQREAILEVALQDVGGPTPLTLDVLETDATARGGRVEVSRDD